MRAGRVRARAMNILLNTPRKMADGLTDQLLQECVDVCRRKQLNVPERDHLRDIEERVYVNRSVNMDRIKYIGFDMDYTLIEYKSPEYEKLSFELSMKRLVSIGYPKDILKLKYDPSYPLRGLFFDKLYGNLLKCDTFGNILSCFHGFRSLTNLQIQELYPNKYVMPTDDRIFILYTLFHLSETYILALLVDYFEKLPGYERVREGPERFQGVKCGDVFVSYAMIHHDIRTSVDWAHNEGDMKSKTVSDVQRYTQKSPRLPQLLNQLRESGRKVFLVTNSGYHYTKKMLSYLLEFPEFERDWNSYFDYIIVDANKPRFFSEGTMLRSVDEETSSLKLGVFTGALQSGKVYSGGSSAAFCKYSGAKGKEILYVGDHIFGDVIKAKKEQAWRTFLVLPELNNEISVWNSLKPLHLRLQNLEYLLTERNRNQMVDGQNFPSVESLRRAIRQTAEEMENSYSSQLGSLLRCGSRLTYIANQVTRFADLYGSSCLNLMNYPSSYLFTAPHQLMAHESHVSTMDSTSTPNPTSPFPSRMARTATIIETEMDEEGPLKNMVAASNGSA